MFCLPLAHLWRHVQSLLDMKLLGIMRGHTESHVGGFGNEEMTLGLHGGWSPVSVLPLFTGGDV